MRKNSLRLAAVCAKGPVSREGRWMALGLTECFGCGNKVLRVFSGRNTLLCSACVDARDRRDEAVSLRRFLSGAG